MADLDDFFAKKDRKKSKGGKKFTTTEELAKKLEETHRREKEKVKENKKLLSSQNVDGDGEPGSERKEEDEWKDFEEEKKDYTNLKIQNLQISETANADNGDGDDDENEMVENEDGVMVSRKKQPSGPWMSVPQAPQPEEPVREEIRSQPPPPTDGGGGGGKSGYIPPHLRNAPSHYAPATSFSPSPSSYSSPNSYSSSMHHQPLSSSRFKSRAAPDITNEAYFPTLSAANNDTPNTAWGRRREDGRGFEEVRNARTNTSTYNPKMASSGQGPNLSLGNKWDALRDQS
ncbi:protein CDV3 homolog [Thrips palmi]|uniref:Protein CDV3 homolog n=1 Tax=Thrips palmi TaxID=161013 RepID=A0A6P9AKM8_THRPL|nr:protein CDV3 homolog [Thrips palmi]XP_034256042.1 protein CDV3 homolog [Thrips palmi]